MQHPSLDKSMLLVLLCVIVGFSLILLSSQLPIQTLVALLTAISAIATAVAAGYSAVSAKASERVANRWEKEIKHKLLTDKWKDLEASVKEVFDTAQAFSEHLTLLQNIQFSEDYLKDPQRLVKNLHTIFKQDIYKEAANNIVDSAEKYFHEVKKFHQLANSWHTLEERPDKVKVLQLSSNILQEIELGIHFIRVFGEEWQAYGRRISIYSDNNQALEEKKAKDLALSITSLPKHSILPEIRIVYDSVLYDFIPMPTTDTSPPN